MNLFYSFIFGGIMVAIIVLIGIVSIICSALLVMVIAFKLFSNKEDKEK